MGALSWVARPIDGTTRALIARSTLWHFTKPRFLQQIRKGTFPRSNLEQIHLRASQGWSINPTKLIRDWSVWDTEFSAKDYSHYQYFFLSKPKDSEIAFLRIQGITSLIQIEGTNVLKFCQGRIFYRTGDKAVAIRGDYNGPGITFEDYKEAFDSRANQ